LDKLASIVIVTYNHQKYLDNCIRSVQQQEYPHEIIIVDNGSEDNTVDFVTSNFPDIRLIRNKNTGYGAGNNIGVTHSSGEYVVILNPDTITEKNWLRELITPIQTDPDIITTPKILLFDGSAINTCGNINHITGLTFTRGLYAHPQSHDQKEEVSGISGACFAMRRDAFIRIGGFDERFFLYNEDSEFSWRAHLFQIPVLYIPSSIIYHDYSLSVSPQKMYHLEKGRYLILKTYLSRKMIVVFLPSLIIAEILTLGYAARFGLKGISLKVRVFFKEAVLGGGDSHFRNGAGVIEYLETQIPTDQLVLNGSEQGFMRICNKVFLWNYTVFKRMFLRKE
jgi:GT2 family glycosyltransferase